MDQLTKDDLAQIDRTYLQSLEEETVIDVACKLRDFAVILVERLEQNSSNSSRPPSSDSPYDKGNGCGSFAFFDITIPCFSVHWSDESLLDCFKMTGVLSR